jgi:hypothetical protein
MSNWTIGTIMEFISNFLKIDSTSSDANNGSPADGFGGGVYGGQLAGNRFDFLYFIKKPQVILRLVAMVRLLAV